MDFFVEPDSFPPTNIHVLIGRNGVGKTYLLARMTDCILQQGDPAACGVFTSGSPGNRDRDRDVATFANLVSVSFSAFDDFELIPDRRPLEDGVGYAYVGLKRTSNRGAGKGTPKSPDMLTKEFVSSLGECLNGSRKEALAPGDGCITDRSSLQE